MNDLTPLLQPRSIAVVGATSRPGAYGDETLRNLKRLGFRGRVWGVHPTRKRVHGRMCVPTLADLPEPVDAVVVAIPAAGVPEVIDQAGARGCGGAVVYGAGFGETPAGTRLQERREVAQCSTPSTPRRSSARATISRWISLVPSQMRSTRSSRHRRSATFVRM